VAERSRQTKQPKELIRWSHIDSPHRIETLVEMLNRVGKPVKLAIS
jgi:hypothetical protein